MRRSSISITGSRRRNAVLASACAAAGVLTLVGTASAASPPVTGTRHSCRNAILKHLYLLQRWLAGFQAQERAIFVSIHGGSGIPEWSSVQRAARCRARKSRSIVFVVSSMARS